MIIFSVYDHVLVQLYTVADQYWYHFGLRNCDCETVLPLKFACFISHC